LNLEKFVCANIFVQIHKATIASNVFIKRV
jgi:hypothetical protein